MKNTKPQAPGSDVNFNFQHRKFKFTSGPVLFLALLIAILLSQTPLSAQPAQAIRPGAPAAPPPGGIIDRDIKFTTMTQERLFLPDASTTPTAADWNRLSLSIDASDSTQRGVNPGHWHCLPGPITVVLEIPAALRWHISGVVFQSRWIDAAFDSPITFHTRRLPHPRAGSERQFARLQHIRAPFTAPVYGDYHLWAEVVDKHGERHLSPTIILHCAKDLPPAPTAVPIGDVLPHRP